MTHLARAMLLIVCLGGSAWADTFTAEPPAWDFGFVLQGDISAPQVFRITYHGEKPVRSTIASTIFGHAGVFLLLDDTCSGRLFLPGSTCEVGIAAVGVDHPSALGEHRNVWQLDLIDPADLEATTIGMVRIPAAATTVEAMPPPEAPPVPAAPLEQPTPLDQAASAASGAGCTLASGSQASMGILPISLLCLMVARRFRPALAYLGSLTPPHQQ